MLKVWRRKRWIILDRDGVLVIDFGYTYEIEKLEFPPKLIEGLRQLQEMGYGFLIATNQSGIARGMYTIEQMHAFNDALIAKLAAEGIEITGLAFCPHGKKEDCLCRKPKTGMLDQLNDQVVRATGEPIDWTTSWGIGDKPADAEMISAKGGHSVLMISSDDNNRTGEKYWEYADTAVQKLLQNERNFFIAKDMVAAVERVRKYSPAE